MASIIASTLRAGKKARDKQGWDDHLSKVVELNGKYRLFFRTCEVEPGVRDIAVAAVTGRSLDYDVIGSTFIAYNKDMCEADEAGSIKDNTELPSWARIARVIYDAQCNREKKNLETEAENSAKELGTTIDTVALQKALNGVELKYHGGKADDGTKIPPKNRPAISGMQQKMSTSLVVVKLLPDGKPDWEHAKQAVLELSNAKVNELITLSENPAYFHNDLDYLEVGYDYIGADKQAAGRAAKFQGISKELSLANLYPDTWESHGKKIVEGLPNGAKVEDIAELMVSRNRNLKASRTPSEIISSFKKWCATNQAVFASIDFEDDNVRRTAKDFLKESILDSIPTVKQRFEEIAKEDSESESKPAPIEQEETKGLNDAAKMMEAASNPTLNQIAAAVPNVNLATDDDLGEL